MFGSIFIFFTAIFFFWWVFFTCSFSVSFFLFDSWMVVVALSWILFAKSLLKVLSYSWTRYLQEVQAEGYSAQFCTSKSLSWFRVLHENHLVFYFVTAKGDRQPWGFSQGKGVSSTATETDRCKNACLCDSLLSFTSPSSYDQTRCRETPAISLGNVLCF